MNAAGIWDLVRLSLAAPGPALERLRGLGLNTGQRWMALALAAVVSTVLASGAEALFPVNVAGPVALLKEVPLALAGVQFGTATLAAALIAGIGRAFGGRGSFDDALLMVAWVEAIIIALQFVQVALMLLFPAVAAVLTMVAFGLYVFLMVRLTTALHGFSNPFIVGAVMIATLLFAGMVLSIVLGALGLAPPLPESAP